MFAQFFEDESAARQALAAWTDKVRPDWTVSRSREVIRMGGDPWTEGSVAPACRAQVQGRPMRLLRAEAHGPFARSGGDNQGTSTAVLEVCFPKEV